MRIKWIEWMALSLAVLVLPFSSAFSAEAKQPECRLQRYASIDLSTNQSGFILLPVSVNGRQALVALELAFSTGAINPEGLKHLGLEPRSLNFGVEVRSKGKSVRQYVTAKDLIVDGQVRYENMEFLVLNDLSIKPSILAGAPPVIGYLGLTNFGNVDIELDVAASKLNLYLPSSCPDRVVYWANEYSKVPMKQGRLGELFFLMELEGKKLQTTLSTSNQTSVLYTDASRKLYDFDEKSPGNIRESKDGEETTYYRAMALTNDSMKVLNANIELRNRDSSCGVVRNRANDAEGVGYDNCFGAYPLSLGLSVLRRMHIYIASKEKALYFTLNNKVETSP